MRVPFKKPSLESQLAASRPQAPERLVSSIVGRVTPQQKRRVLLARHWG